MEIYRYLLLSTPLIYAGHLDPPKHAFHSHTYDFEEALEESSEDGWTDETEEDSDHDSLLSVMMYDLEEEIDEDSESDEESTDDEGFEMETTKREMVIFRTNRRIYSEASGLFYSEAMLTLEPADIFCLAKNPYDLEFGHTNQLTPWKHNPLKGIGRKNKAGAVIYDSRELRGDLEPHILAKFQKITFDAHFDEEDTGSMELWIDDDTHVIRDDDASRFQNLLTSSLVFKHLAKILSNSPRITHLDIRLEVEVISTSNLILEDEELDDLLEDSDDEDEERAIKVDRIMEIANFRATELLLDSKIMKPLLKLKNVSHCRFKFGFEHLHENEAYTAPAKYVKMLTKMRDKIESNFTEPVDEA